MKTEQNNIRKFSAVVIGVSAGGLHALISILSKLPKEYSLPVIIVQHRGKDHKELLEDVLQTKCLLKIKQADEKEKIEKKQDKGSMQGDFAQAFQMQTLYFFPLMLGYLSFSFPVGLSLYWNTFTIFGIIQQYQVQKAKKLETEGKSGKTKEVAKGHLAPGRKK